MFSTMQMFECFMRECEILFEENLLTGQCLLSTFSSIDEELKNKYKEYGASLELMLV